MVNLHFSVLSLFLICSSTWASPQYENITAVENGLLPANVFKGDQAWTLQERMQHYGVPGVGIAVIHDSKVAWFKTYGLADRETGEVAENSTLFQAGSVSKPVAAFGALQMVEAGELSLDADVNASLKSWKLPENEFTAGSRVTLKQLLSHTGGLTVHGFGGYAVGDEVPGEILDTGAYEDALTAFRAALKKSSDEETLSENYLNGYALNSLEDSPTFSTKLLQINTDLYPDSANTWDSLALAYQKAGNKEKAIEHYRNALKRDPKFASALRALAELQRTEELP